MDEATGAPRRHHFKRWARADDYHKRGDDESYGRFLAALVLVGADPVLHETWVGKVLLVRSGVCGLKFPAATFAEHKAGWLLGAAATLRDPDPTWPPVPAGAFVSRSA